MLKLPIESNQTVLKLKQKLLLGVLCLNKVFSILFSLGQVKNPLNPVRLRKPKEVMHFFYFLFGPTVAHQSMT